MTYRYLSPCYSLNRVGTAGGASGAGGGVGSSMRTSRPGGGRIQSVGASGGAGTGGGRVQVAAAGGRVGTGSSSMAIRVTSLAELVSLVVGVGVTSKVVALRLAIEESGLGVTAGQGAAVLLEVGHADCRKGGGLVVLSGVVVVLVDGDGRVYDVGFDSLAVNDWLLEN